MRAKTKHYARTMRGYIQDRMHHDIHNDTKRKAFQSPIKTMRRKSTLCAARAFHAGRSQKDPGCDNENHKTGSTAKRASDKAQTGSTATRKLCADCKLNPCCEFGKQVLIICGSRVQWEPSTVGNRVQWVPSAVGTERSGS
jgi:hypothetical protein